MSGARTAEVHPASLPGQIAPPAPDYRRPDSWAARPGHEGAAAAVAPGASAPAAHPAADVFYVHPSTDHSPAHWNQDIADSDVNRWTDQSVVARQAGVFNGCCRIFAPRYRQAVVAMAADAGARKASFAIAYSDVLRAFDDYIRRDNHGRPFILVGHSQGAAHVAKLLEDRIDGAPLGRRMVAAYVIGVPLVEGDFGRTYKTIRFCDAPLQTGCVLEWNTILPDGDRKPFVAYSAKAYVDRYGDVPGQTPLCINPLTFDRAKPAAGIEASRGAVPGSPGLGAIAPLIAHAVGARCDGGLLIVEPSPDLMLQPIAGGSMHFHDIGLFYEDIRENAAARVAAFLKAHPQYDSSRRTDHER